MGIMDKKLEQRSGFDEWYKDFISGLPLAKQGALSGIGMAKMTEPLPIFNQAECEHVIGGNNGWYGSYIVLGRDRPASPAPHDSGYGPKGATGAASIDLVVGRNAAVEFGLQSAQDMSTGEATPVNPDFNTDAARVYISQRSDIDAYFGIAEIDTAKMPPAQGKSAVALKADNVRLIARETIKLVSAFPDKYNSQGTKNADCKGGVYLVHGTSGTANEKLYSMVRGEKLQNALNAIVDMIGNLADAVSKTDQVLSQLCGAYAAHQHVATPGGGPTTPLDAPVGAVLAMAPLVEELVKLGVSHSTNDAGFRVNYLRNFGGEYILSHWHKLN